MRAVPTLASLVALLVLPMAVVQADAITVDGSSADWPSPPDTLHDDPDDDADNGYDIDENWFVWDEINDHVAFGFTTNDDMAAGTADNFSRIIMDTKTGGGVISGFSGQDYYIEYDLYDPGSYFMKYWDGSAWQNSSPTYLAVARDTRFLEWACHASDIGWPKEFLWGAHLDDGSELTDDLCPADAKQRGFTPEPGTMVLVPIGLAALAAWRRRKAA